ncbi:hypothetical protein PAXRUDRAFT_821095 [Paxillus rubicundulus Ve08.2h10]|uniref:Palmitoyltransferase n=1 Tax=Paxillus rubicundulus Ve08.2h10 TaxID=930991 RepID=A0A0D0E6Y2_9AGAM|nr:hypothetical protein PAXRUDRAFT_821095 [Paxillus rubicundulus Ve08.2h10]
MATSQSSLSFVPPSSSLVASPSSKKRPPQLPLPSSNFGAVPAQRLQDTNAALSRSSSVGAQRGRALTINGRSSSAAGHHKQGSHPQGPREPPLSSPPTITTFQIPPIPSTGLSTHAGGILPSASFFRPSRPVYSRPSSSPSMTSNEVLPQFNSAPPEQFPLTPMTRYVSRESELGSIGDPSSLREPCNLSKRFKHSREPLLPLSNKPSATTGAVPLRPSLPRNPSQKSSSGNRVRSSVDRVFRGISFDSIRDKSNGSLHTSRLSSTEEQSHDGARPVDDVPFSSLPMPRKPMAHPLVQIPSSRLTSSPTPNHVFIPEPPNTIPSLSAMPLKPQKRNYQLHPSRNRFFCGGRLLTGGDSPWAFIASLTLVCGISGVWFSTTCVWWWQNESPAVAAVGAYMCLLTVSCMLTTALRDPGILPRDLDPDPPFPATSPSDGSVRVPLPRDLKVRTDTVRVKYCATCKTYRPPRSSHCKMCDNCVDNCDHHCQWVNNCVGRRNYTFFFCFLFSGVLTLCLVICTCAIHLYLLIQKDTVNFRNALEHGIGSAVAFSLSILVIWPVTALLAYHMRLLLLNITTIEQIRNQAHKTLVPGAAPPNPFTFGSWRSNLAEVLCRPAGFSWLNGHGYATEDKRRVNPGLDDVGLGWDDNDVERGGGERAGNE